MGYATRPEISGNRPLDRNDLGSLWRAFRSSQAASCPRDAAPLALAVDAANGIYRFVCTRCGRASPWFVSSLDGAELRIVTGGSQSRSGVVDV